MSNKTILQAKNTRLNANNTDLSSILQTINNLPEQTEVKLQTKTVSPSTAVQNVTADSGYDGLSKVTVNAMSTTTQATPSISVNSSGLITASATQSAGYVSAGTKSSTKQLTTKAATTYTPTTSNQTIASGTYLTGTQTIKGDSNLIASNIRSGKSIFGVAGTLVEGITPAGTLDITANGSYDVTNYASANVNVASSGGGGKNIITVAKFVADTEMCIMQGFGGNVNLTNQFSIMLIGLGSNEALDNISFTYDEETEGYIYEGQIGTASISITAGKGTGSLMELPYPSWQDEIVTTIYAVVHGFSQAPIMLMLVEL